ncbi:MAG: 3-keto-5-aminohexanoate cleavage protein, partial [Geminicoccaceae bacterium]|nr:3-keto-5-aminohexanoate cleavage protein [Geminicoccaceae bacterium]
PADLLTLQAMVHQLPSDAIWSAFAISRMEMPFVAAAALLGGNVRVGLEDNLYLEKGVFASNAQLVERAREILERMGCRVLGPGEVRARLGLRKPG